ncbi:MAG: hypothetical protein IKS29_08115 [Oscillospiraceae bacterium]|nr:hypothetical protein [Oscillospiraceae bacterium]
MKKRLTILLIGFLILCGCAAKRPVTIQLEEPESRVHPAAAAQEEHVPAVAEEPLVEAEDPEAEPEPEPQQEKTAPESAEEGPETVPAEDSQTVEPVPLEVETGPEEPEDRSLPAASEEQAQDYVLNTNTKKFHYPDCSSVSDMKPENRQDVHEDRESILARGFVPCKRCKP